MIGGRFGMLAALLLMMPPPPRRRDLVKLGQHRLEPADPDWRCVDCLAVGPLPSFSTSSCGTIAVEVVVEPSAPAGTGIVAGSATIAHNSAPAVSANNPSTPGGGSSSGDPL